MSTTTYTINPEHTAIPPFAIIHQIVLADDAEHKAYWTEVLVEIARLRGMVSPTNWANWAIDNAFHAEVHNGWMFGWTPERMALEAEHAILTSEA